MRVNPESLSDNEIFDLIFQIRSGNDNSFARLLELFGPLIDASASRLFASIPSVDDTEDVKQEANLALYRAAMSFDLGQNKVTFGLYAKICINNALTTKYKRAARKLPLNFCSLDELDESAGVTFEDISSSLIDSETYAELDSKIRACLSEYEYKVFGMYVDGFSRLEIAVKLNKNEKSVSNAVQRITEKLRKILCGE